MSRPSRSLSSLSSSSSSSASSAETLIGAVEAGGTSCVLAVAKGSPTNIIERVRIKTTTHKETIGQAVNFFRERRVASIGLAWFGPLDVDPKSKTYGYVTSTPKAQWRNVDVLSPFKPLGVPLGFDTDVQAAAVGELNYGKHGAISSCAYITVGTGVGVGVIVHGRPVYGLTHPEGGHVRVQRHPKDKYTGNCRYHGDCVEGLTNAESIAARAGCHESNLKSLPDNHLAFEIVAYYLGQLCCNLVLTVSPQVIVLGGGVMQRKSLFPRIRQQVLSLLNGYVQMDKILNDIDSYIVPSIHDQGPENNAGLVGALELARLALAQRSKL